MTSPDPAGPPPAPQPAPDPEHAANRRADKHVAVIAVIGVILGGLIGAGSSYYATSSQSSQNLDNYRRDQRTEVYAQISTAIDQLAAETVELTLSPPSSSGITFNPDGTPAEIDTSKVEGALTLAATVMTRAGVTASDNVWQSASQAIWDQAYFFLGSIQQIDQIQRSAEAIRTTSIDNPPGELLFTLASAKAQDIFHRFVINNVYLNRFEPDNDSYAGLDVQQLLERAQESRNAYIDAVRVDLDLDED